MYPKALQADAVVERIRTNSILNPLLWLCGIVIPFSIFSAYLSRGWMRVFFCILIAVVIGLTLVAYFIWTFRDPDRLQSEDYQLEKQRILQGSKEEENIPVMAQSSDHPPALLQNADITKPDDPVDAEQDRLENNLTETDNL